MKLTRTTIIFFIIFLIQINTIAVSSNSAQSDWEGVDSTGTIVTDEDCPIVVENELLTFDIDEFPKNHYENKSDFLSYTGIVKAQYTFYNPADYTVNAKLVFPFGAFPSYGWHNDNQGEGEQVFDEDTEKYNITIDGNTIEKKLRYTFFDRTYQFEFEKDMALLRDDYVEDSFFTLDMPVTKYTYTVSNIDDEQFPAASIAFDISSFDGKRRILFEQQSGFHIQEDGRTRISAWVNNGRQLTLYVIGEPNTSKLYCKFYEDGSVEDGKEIEGVAILTSTSEFSFKDFVMMNFSTGNNNLEIDWYNAMVAAFNQSIMDDSSVILFFDRFSSFDISSSLMRWYEYEITLEPGQHLVNTVESPIYPSIYGEYEPPIYEYTYLLSPAQTWAEFGELEILIDTPFFVMESSLKDFVKTESGYKLEIDGLPKGELTFRMCSSEESKKSEKTYAGALKYLFPLAIGICMIVGMIISIIIKAMKKH